MPAQAPAGGSTAVQCFLCHCCWVPSSSPVASSCTPYSASLTYSTIVTAHVAGPGVRQQQAHAGSSSGLRQGCAGPCRAAATIYPSAKPPPAPSSAESSGPEELSSVYYEAGGVNVRALREQNGEQMVVHFGASRKCSSSWMTWQTIV